MTETSDWVLESWFMILLQNIYRDPDRGQILTTTYAPPLPHLSESVEEKCESEFIKRLLLSPSLIFAVRRSSGVSLCITVNPRN